MADDDSLPQMTDSAELFARQKYLVWHSCLNDPELTLLYRWACRRAEVGTMFLDDTSPGASPPLETFLWTGC